MSLVRWSLVATGVVLMASLPASCSASNSDAGMTPVPCYGPSCDGGALNLDHYSEVVVGSDASVSDADGGIDPLCGTGTPCNPDDDTPICPSSDGGVGCIVQPADSGTPAPQCQVAGSGMATDPCQSAADCAPGYACVGNPRNFSVDGSQTGGGWCRHYCCGGADQCASGTFCAGRVLFDSNASGDQVVPVCVGADNCKLDEPYQCDASANSECKCTDNTACAVVRADGTTSCLPPGTGVTGEACTCVTGGVCTCAPGYVCSSATQTCQELCSTSGQSCSSGICQSSPFLPPGFGICAGS